MNAKKNQTSLPEMQLTISTAEPISITPTAQFLTDYHQCCLCGTELQYTHVTNFIREEVKEEAHCPSCQVRTKEQQHRLQ